MEKKRHIQNLISENKIKDALDVFLAWALEKGDGELENQLIHVQGRFARLKQQENMGIIQFSDSLREQAIITNSILDMLNQYKDSDPNAGEKVKPPSDTRRTILFLASNPSETAKLQLEKEFVRISVGIQEGASELKLVSEWAVKPGDLQQAIIKHRPNIIHFSGHGASAKEGAGRECEIMLEGTEQGGIVLEDATGESVLVRTTVLANLFETLLGLDGLNIEVVILNACHQEDQARAIARFVPYVIGTNDAIADNAAIEFSTGFYRGITAKGSNVEFAFRLAKNNIMLTMMEDDSAVPVLYKKA